MDKLTEFQRIVLASSPPEEKAVVIDRPADLLYYSHPNENEDGPFIRIGDGGDRYHIWARNSRGGDTFFSLNKARVSDMIELILAEPWNRDKELEG